MKARRMTMRRGAAAAAMGIAILGGITTATPAHAGDTVSGASAEAAGDGLGRCQPALQDLPPRRHPPGRAHLLLQPALVAPASCTRHVHQPPQPPHHLHAVGSLAQARPEVLHELQLRRRLRVRLGGPALGQPRGRTSDCGAVQHHPAHPTEPGDPGVQRQRRVRCTSGVPLSRCCSPAGRPGPSACRRYDHGHDGFGTDDPRDLRRTSSRRTNQGDV